MSTKIVSPEAAKPSAANKVSLGVDAEVPALPLFPTAVQYTSPVVEPSFTYQFAEYPVKLNNNTKIDKISNLFFIVNNYIVIFVL